MGASIIRNFPSWSIMLCLFSGIVSSVLKKRGARLVNTILLLSVSVMSGALLIFTWNSGVAYTYQMGNFPAPWGNELRFTCLEAAIALFFCIIMFLSLFGGNEHLNAEVEGRKHNLYYVLTDLLLASLLALLYTNDMFTAYVFVEINTIAACGLIMVRQVGRTIEAAVRYMIMSLLGSGLLLMGICMLYDMTGQLLMTQMHDSVVQIMATGDYHVPMTVAVCIITVGLAIKSALFPFHAWLPDAYGYSTVGSSAMLSSLVSKGYIFLLIKIIYRVIGFEAYHDTKIIHVLFIFGLCGMIFGSVSAIKENDIRRMIAFSSVAQIGYIYMGFGLGTFAGMSASIFHIFSHAASKSLLFIAAIGLTDVSGGSRKFSDLTGAGYRHKIAGVAFTVGSLSMVGIPLFPGFISKILFAQASIQNHGKMLPALIVLAISTILNAIYFLKTVIRLYTPVENSEYTVARAKEHKGYTLALILFIIINLAIGTCSEYLVNVINGGLLNEIAEGGKSLLNLLQTTLPA
ncbi:MAG: sodium:proton antiporter [Lachnospiraceae bacterium]|nr:sodium:proton antiporter [Lachnospiraceae bacterium]